MKENLKVLVCRNIVFLLLVQVLVDGLVSRFLFVVMVSVKVLINPLGPVLVQIQVPVQVVYFLVPVLVLVSVLLLVQVLVLVQVVVLVLVLVQVEVQVPLWPEASRLLQQVVSHTAPPSEANWIKPRLLLPSC